MNPTPSPSNTPDLAARRRAIEMSFLETRLMRGIGGLHFENIEWLMLAVERALSWMGLIERGQDNARRIAVRELTVEMPLPLAFDGYRILHLSDLHLDGLAGHPEALARQVAAVEADLCVMTGDYRFDIQGPCHNVVRHLHGVIDAVCAPDGVFAILGNHDFLEIGEALGEMGVRMLINDSAAVRRGDDALWLAGVDDPHFYGCADLDRALGGVPDDAHPILLIHTPEMIRRAAAHGVGLYLCGHTHAGQIRLPVVGAPYNNARCRRKYCAGPWRVDGMTGFTHYGSGSSGVPVRFGCPPEVAVLTLRAAG